MLYIYMHICIYVYTCVSYIAPGSLGALVPRQRGSRRRQRAPHMRLRYDGSELAAPPALLLARLEALALHQKGGSCAAPVNSMYICISVRYVVYTCM